jgi:hypothetical protein
MAMWSMKKPRHAERDEYKTLYMAKLLSITITEPI